MLLYVINAIGVAMSITRMILVGTVVLIAQKFATIAGKVIKTVKLKPNKFEQKSAQYHQKSRILRKVLHIGDEMDIDKEKKLHESWYKQQDPVAYKWYLRESPEFVRDFSQSEKSWLAAKTSHEGFVLMPIKPTEKILQAIFDNKNSTAKAYKAMIEAQEQSHD